MLNSMASILNVKVDGVNQLDFFRNMIFVFLSQASHFLYPNFKGFSPTVSLCIEKIIDKLFLGKIISSCEKSCLNFFNCMNYLFLQTTNLEKKNLTILIPVIAAVAVRKKALITFYQVLFSVTVNLFIS